MRITDILKEEHRVIEQVLDCLEQLVERTRLGDGLDRQSASDALRFFQNFADRCHHGKEENQLFPAMVRKGIPKDVGPIGVMLAEHETGRAAVREMEAALCQPREHDTAVEKFVQVAAGYVEHLRSHILKEDHILFPLADSLLDEEEQGDLLEEFRRVESEEMGEGAHEGFVALADQLARRFGVPLAADRTERPFEGCCHQL